MTPKEILSSVETILLVDWPSKDVPEALTRAGFRVFVHGGPAPEDYSAYVVDNSEVVSRYLGHPPEQADLVYSYRPLSELPEILALASKLKAKTLWTQSGFSAAGKDDVKGCWLPENELQSAQGMVKAAGLHNVTQPYIADAAREARSSR